MTRPWCLTGRSEHFTRAAPGGTGAVKCGGNYAAALAGQLEAMAAGCDQTVWLDAVEHRWVVRSALLGIQYGTEADRYGWRHKIC